MRDGPLPLPQSWVRHGPQIARLLMPARGRRSGYYERRRHLYSFYMDLSPVGSHALYGLPSLLQGPGSAGIRLGAARGHCHSHPPLHERRGEKKNDKKRRESGPSFIRFMEPSLRRV